ncbi:hypothetical protein J5X84_16100 [Streptosporangiaceae bacterium NEAU-GS5]|nr:hypothetical protein [Streptosporangiaceae bacterium NEAU-GS5]
MKKHIRRLVGAIVFAVLIVVPITGSPASASTLIGVKLPVSVVLPLCCGSWP